VWYDAACCVAVSWFLFALLNFNPLPTMLMRILTSATAALLCAIIPITARAQARPQLDSGQMAALMASAAQMNKPAAFVLLHRADLALTAEQVSSLEALVVAQRDSTVARQSRLVSLTQSNPPSSAMVAAGSWSGELDERALREALCQSSANQAELLLGLARDRRATAAVLTPAQVAQLPALQANDMMKAIKRP
jgi:hypothetical protein